MKLYRGVSKKKCGYYKKYGIPSGENFTTILKGAKNKGCCIIYVRKTKNFNPDKKSNKTFRELDINERYFRNIKPIKKFKIR